MSTTPTYHVLRMTQSTGLRERWGVVKEIDQFFSGVKILVRLPDEEHFRGVEMAHQRARELNTGATARAAKDRNP